MSAAPALVSGKALALAVDEGFLTHYLPTAVLHLSVCALCALGGAWAGRQTYPPLADIVEPLRDRLHRDVVRGTLRRAVAPSHGARRARAPTPWSSPSSPGRSRSYATPSPDN